MKTLLITALMLVGFIVQAQEDYRDEKGMLPLKRITMDLLGTIGYAESLPYCTDYGPVIVKTYLSKDSGKHGTIVGVKINVRHSQRDIQMLIERNKDYLYIHKGKKSTEYWYVFNKE